MIAVETLVRFDHAGRKPEDVETVSLGVVVARQENYRGTGWALLKVRDCHDGVVCLIEEQNVRNAEVSA
jgi:hypothetical protein